MLKHKPFLQWWLFVTLVLVGSIIAWSLEVFHTIYEQDITKLSFLIMAIFCYMTIWCGLKTWKLSRIPDKSAVEETRRLAALNTPLQKITDDERCELDLHNLISTKAEIGWFASDLCLTIGMIGTVIGFIFMLSSGFVNIDVANTASMQNVLLKIGTGMATALYTTLVGLVASALLKIQYFNLSIALEKMKNE